MNKYRTDRFYNIIKSLILKATKKYNDNRNERIECLKKAEHLATKSNWFFMFENDFNKIAIELEDELYEQSEYKQESSHEESIDNYRVFLEEFQENFKGNLIFKEIIDTKYNKTIIYVITIVFCRNGHFGVISSDTDMKFFNDLDMAKEYAYKIYKEVKNDNG